MRAIVPGFPFGLSEDSRPNGLPRGGLSEYFSGGFAGKGKGSRPYAAWNLKPRESIALDKDAAPRMNMGGSTRRCPARVQVASPRLFRPVPATVSVSGWLL